MKAFCMIILVLAVTAISATNIGSDEVDTNNRPGPSNIILIFKSFFKNLLNFV
jgi:hypothetical protein